MMPQGIARHSTIPRSRRAPRRRSSIVRQGEPPPGSRPFAVALALVGLGLVGGHPLPALGDVGIRSDVKKPAQMSIEELLDVEVTSVSKRPESRLEAAAAIAVVTQEDIRRSGVTTLVDALALVPGVEVSRINASQWAVGIRGFQSRLSRSVLVLIDGRSVYTPLFAGVYWEAQDTLLEDVERIEVIRGPGASLWGANAVNGVVNIITKVASDTKGALVSGLVGSEDRAILAARYGGAVADTSYRVYLKRSDRDAQFHASGNDYDTWHATQGGFRTDSRLGTSLLTIQGDAYATGFGERVNVSSFSVPYLTSVESRGDLSGQNLLTRFLGARADGTETRIQTYLDHTHHGETQFEESRTTFDVELQDRRLLPLRQEVTWGLGFRSSRSETSSIPTLVINASRATERLFSAFLQDEIAVVPGRLRLTLGTKLEHNDYTGVEVQPSARLVFLPGQGHVFWAAVSRAVRTPSRVEFDVSKSVAAAPPSPVFARLTGDGGFVSEKLVAYEAGYRARIASRVQLDVAVFYDDLDDLTSGELSGAPFAEGSGAETRIVIPFAFRNGLTGKSRGAEVSADVAPLSWLTVRAGYAYLALDLRPKPGATDLVSGPNIEGASPRHTGSLGLHAALPAGVSSDVTLRFVDRLPGQNVPGYFDLSLRVAWSVLPGLEVSVVGQGLLRPHQLQFAGGDAGNTEIQGAVYGKATWRF